MIFPVIVFSSQYLTYSAVPLHQILLVTLSFFSAQIRVRRSTAAHEANQSNGGGFSRSWWWDRVARVGVGD